MLAQEVKSHVQLQIRVTSKDNDQYIYNVLSIKNITLDSKQRKHNSDLRVKILVPQGQLTS